MTMTLSLSPGRSHDQLPASQPRCSTDDGRLPWLPDMNLLVHVLYCRILKVRTPDHRIGHSHLSSCPFQVPELQFHWSLSRLPSGKKNFQWQLAELITVSVI